MMFTQLITDNPLLMKHVRARLRRQYLLPWLAIVIVLAACITWLGFYPRDTTGISASEAVELYKNAHDMALAWLLVLQGLLLLVIGTAMVAGSATAAREGGMLDFHRISPQSPLALAAGFLIGGPIRELILFACTLPFLIPFFTLGSHYALGLLAVLLVMVTSALFYYALALALALITPKPRGAAALAMLLVVLFQIGYFLLPVAYFGVLPVIVPLFDSSTSWFNGFFGFLLPVALLVALHQLVFFVFLFGAAVRKLRYERAFPFARPVAVLFLAIVALFILGDVTPAPDLMNEHNHDHLPLEFLPVLVVYLVSLLGTILAIGMTPSFGNFIKGIRHARKLQLPRVPLWSDPAANWAPVLAFAATTLLAGICAVWLLPPDAAEWTSRFSVPVNYLLAGLIGAMAVTYSGFFRQIFNLFYPKNGTIYFAVFLFLFWIVPLLIGMVASAIGASDTTNQVIFGLTPLAGIALTAFSDQISGNDLHSMIGRTVALSSTAILLIASLVLYPYAVRKASRAAVVAPGDGSPLP